MNEAADDPIIGTAEAARILGWSRRKVQRVLANTDQIPVIRIGARDAYVIHASDLPKLAQHDKP